MLRPKNGGQNPGPGLSAGQPLQDTMDLYGRAASPFGTKGSIMTRFDEIRHLD